MNEIDFVSRRKAGWDRLFALTDRAEGNIRNLSGPDLASFARLYREVAGDLAAVRTQGGNPALEQYLNDLIARGNGVLYRRRRRPFVAAVGDFIQESASAVRRRKGYVLAAISVFFAAALFGGSFVSKDESLIAEVVPPEFFQSLEQWKSKEFSQKTAEEGLAGTGFYIQNNTMATLICAAGGLTFGLGSLYILFFNGALMGVFSHEIAEVGGLGHFLTGIAAHGVTEIGGIFVAGAAGLLMGWAFVNPGRRTRGQAIRRAGKDAVYMIGLGTCMIWLAAPVEAFISFSSTVPSVAKGLFGAGTLACWLLLFVKSGLHLDADRRAERHG
jgi:uncharacterized membrane protein SpoIIM required for sporulation